MTGRVVSAENPSLDVAGAVVTVTATYPASRQATGRYTTVSTDATPGRSATRADETTAAPQSVTTNATGLFDFPQVPTGDTSGTVQVTVTPDASSDRRDQQLTFTLTKDQIANLVIALPRKSLDVSVGKTIQIKPLRATLPTGDAVLLNAQVLDASGKPLSILPTLLSQGYAGIVTPDGRYKANSLGTGTVTAFWYNGLKTAPTTIIVSDAAPATPPPVPGPIDTTTGTATKDSKPSTPILSVTEVPFRR